MIKSLKEQTAFVIDRCDTLRLAESTDVFVVVTANWLVACITGYSGIPVKFRSMEKKANGGLLNVLNVLILPAFYC